MNDCLFCKMISGEIPCDIVYENKSVLALIPKKHIQSINALKASEQNLAGEFLLTAQKIAQIEDIAVSGFRTIFNTNTHGGQTVFHIHMHIMGGRQMNWPPG